MISSTKSERSQKMPSIATWTSYQVPWLLTVLDSSMPFLLVRSQSRYCLNHSLVFSKILPFLKYLEFLNRIRASTILPRCLVSIIPIPRPLVFPGIACPKFKFGFIFCFWVKKPGVNKLSSPFGKFFIF